MPKKTRTLKLRRTGGVDMRREKKTTGSHYDGAWKRLRLAVLSDQPWCNVCQRIATCVDHIVPISERPELRLDRDNLQPLCDTCHRQKTAKENAQRAIDNRRTKG